MKEQIITKPTLREALNSKISSILVLLKKLPIIGKFIKVLKLDKLTL